MGISSTRLIAHSSPKPDTRLTSARSSSMSQTPSISANQRRVNAMLTRSVDETWPKLRTHYDAAERSHRYRKLFSSETRSLDTVLRLLVDFAFARFLQLRILTLSELLIIFVVMPIWITLAPAFVAAASVCETVISWFKGSLVADMQMRALRRGGA